MSIADDAAGGGAAAAAAADGSTPDVYARLGVRRLLNAYETVSMIGGTRTRPEVWDAMRAAADAFVDMRELHAALGQRLAGLTRNEAAAVTSGASAGLVLCAAACAARRDPDVPLHLTGPWPRGRFEVLVQRCQVSPYVQNLRQAGVGLVEVGYAQSPTPEAHLAAAIDERTVAVLHTAGRPYERHAVPLERVIELAHARGVPVVVDAAALVPPASNLWRYTGLGADLAVFSGGKGLQGPQDSGLVVGRADLVATVRAINSPAHGLGRALKSSKEDAIGLLTAVELALADDESARYRTLLERAERVAEGLRDVPAVEEVTVLPDGRQGQPCPRTAVRLTEASGWRRRDLMAALRAGEPGVVVGALDEDSRSIAVHPLGLTDGEAELVVARIRAVLEAGAAA